MFSCLLLSFWLNPILTAQYNYKFAGLSGSPTSFTEEGSAPGAPIFTMEPTAQPTLIDQGIFFPSSKKLRDNIRYLNIDRAFQAPASKFSFQYWIYIFTYDRFALFQGTINDNGVLEGILFDTIKSGTNLKVYSRYQSSGNYCQPMKKGWNRVRISSNNGFLNSKLYNSLSAEKSATTYTYPFNYSLLYKLGSTASTSNSFILYSFCFTDDDSVVTLSTSSLYPNSLNTCGDGTIQSGSFEECDDGNFVAGDGCNEGCMFESGSCSQTPTICFEECGDGRRFNTLSTYCDDGGKVSGDGCSSTCSVETGYECTNGDSTTPDTCSLICGDGIKVSTEDCDDGNKISGDGCSDACQQETGWFCTGGNLSGSDSCAEECGDGIKTVSETCDDQNTNSGDGCSNTCQQEVGWTCTGGSLSSKDTCTEDCGDGKRFNSLTTYCDDNNTDDGDGCSSTCQVETGYSCQGGSPTQKDDCGPNCGDGFIYEDEQCDDSNSYSGDGCSDSCNVEDKWVCEGGSQTSQSTCRLKCIIENCQTCDSQNNTICVTCIDGYGLNKDFTCRYVQVSESAQAMSSGSAAMTGIGSLVGLIVSLMNLSAPMALWAMANQVQLMLLLLLTKSSLPYDIVGYITTNGFFSFNMKFLPIKSNIISEVPLEWMSKTQSSIELEDMGLESGSSFNNNFGLVFIVLILIFLHLLLTCCPREEKYLNDDLRHKVAKIFKYVWRFFTFGIYIRLLLEAYQFIYISSISELKRIDHYDLQVISSGIFAVFVIICCIIFLILASIQICKEEKMDHHDKFGEFTAGLRETKHSKVYTPFLILRRLLFCTFLVLFSKSGCITLVGFMLSIQILYALHLFYLRPMENKLNNLVECMNEAFYIFFVAFLLKYNSKQAWKGLPTSVYLWTMMMNSTIVVCTILVTNIFICCKKCCRNNKKKIVEKVEISQFPRAQQRSLGKFAERNLNASDISLSKVSSQVTTKLVNFKNNGQGISLNMDAVKRMKDRNKVVPIND
ncbi:unnamed protein product [Moneuplotes crassus]|uniref:TRP C-terminal domain-containing protein n=1 Tax=Euplotes crassus TaxID=5936 RepID=A0AAD1XYR0_EUPCR|nr:unnamed protein product [Moneuplotes crassus]